MAKIYLVRHAESIANTKGIYQGQSYDTGLSMLGKKQALALAHRLSSVNIDKVITSPLRRTKQTGDIIALRKKISIKLESQIIETNHGDWEGKEKSAIAERWGKTYTKWLNNPSGVKFPGGEAFSDTQKRVLGWWKDFVKESEDVLVVTHDNIARIIIADLLRMDLDSIWQFHLHPTAISIIETQGGVTKLTCLNDTNHLKRLNTNLAIHAL